MRSKLLIGGFAAAIAFLLATNPLVAQAAGFITSADIVNNTIRSADVKNNAIKSADIKNNAIKSKDIRDNNLRGVDVRDGSLTHSDLTTGAIGVARGYAWNDLASAPAVATPLTNTYTYNSSGGNVTVSSSSDGVYTVTFTGLSWEPGNVQVTAYDAGSGPAPRWCNVGSWSSPSVRVNCYDEAGNPANSRFTVAVFE